MCSTYQRDPNAELLDLTDDASDGDDGSPPAPPPPGWADARWVDGEAWTYVHLPADDADEPAPF